MYQKLIEMKTNNFGLSSILLALHKQNLVLQTQLEVMNFLQIRLTYNLFKCKPTIGHCLKISYTDKTFNLVIYQYSNKVFKLF